VTYGISVACYIVCGVLYMLITSIFAEVKEEEEKSIENMPTSAIVALLLAGSIAMISVWPIFWAGNIYDQIKGKK